MSDAGRLRLSPGWWQPAISPCPTLGYVVSNRVLGRVLWEALRRAASVHA
jgi:hypothetical protein